MARSSQTNGPPATKHLNCSLAQLLLRHGLQGQCKPRILFAAFVPYIAVFRLGSRAVAVREPTT